MSQGLSVPDLRKWADYLAAAEARRVAVNPITDTEGGLDAQDAYRIQALVVESKLSAGEVVVGAKLGLTSTAKQHTMRVDQPIYGVLTSTMLLEVNQPLACGELIHPRVEPEIAFILGDALSGPRVTAHDVLDATRWVTCGLEVIDSRYANFRFTHADVVADNTSASRFTLGSIRRPPSELPDLSLVGCNLETAGTIVSTATGAATLGHPAVAVALLANWLGERGERLEGGAIVLSGGLTDAVPIAPGGYVSATFAHLGTVCLQAV